MSEQVVFRSWWRDALHGSASSVPGTERLIANVDIALEERGPRGQTPGSGQIQIALAGPHDVVGLSPDAIVRRYPTPGVQDAEETKAVHVEFRDHRLPWRHSPRATPAPEGNLRPWLVLVVAALGTEEVRFDDSTVTFSQDVLAAYPLEDSHRWAHVQESNAMRIARVLSPRNLEAGKEYVAVLVPTWQQRDSDGVLRDAWDEDGVATQSLLVLDKWTFRTGPAGDFRSLASALNPALAPEAGVAVVTYAPLSESQPLRLRGALAPLDSSDDVLDGDVQDSLASLRTEGTGEDQRPVVGLPHYGNLWRTSERDVRWREQLNGDPRYRGAAGLGRRVGIEKQQALTELAVKSLGALQEANQRIRYLALGIAAARSLWNRRLPVTTAEQLELFGPALGRIVTSEGTLLSQVCAPDRPLVGAWFSAAARRVLRKDVERIRAAAPDAASAENLLAEANSCPTPDGTPAGLPDANREPGLREALAKLRALADGSINPLDLDLRGLKDVPFKREPEAALRNLAEAIYQAIESGKGGDVHIGFYLWLLAVAATPEEYASSDSNYFWETIGQAALACAAKHGFDLFNDELHQCLLDIGLSIGDPASDWANLDDLLDLLLPEEEQPCRPIDTTALARGIASAFDPTTEMPRAAERIYSTLVGIDPDPKFGPVERCVGLDLPAWELLRDSAPDWLLPGVGQLRRNAVIAVQANTVFQESFLVGLNQQLLSELTWRATGVAPGCTPIRRFWDRRKPSASDSTVVEANHDMLGVEGWPAASELGDHRPPDSDSEDLVIVFRSDLFHRYPKTVVYLHPRTPGGWPAIDDRNKDLDIYPAFGGSIGQDVSFFGFPGVDSQELNDMWVVLEEPPSGFSFRIPQELPDPPEPPPAPLGDHPSAAEWAQYHLANPVRVLISGDELSPR